MQIFSPWCIFCSDESSAIAFSLISLLGEIEGRRSPMMLSDCKFCYQIDMHCRRVTQWEVLSWRYVGICTFGFSHCIASAVQDAKWLLPGEQLCLMWTTPRHARALLTVEVFLG